MLTINLYESDVILILQYHLNELREIVSRITLSHFGETIKLALHS